MGPAGYITIGVIVAEVLVYNCYNIGGKYLHIHIDIGLGVATLVLDVGREHVVVSQ